MQIDKNRIFKKDTHLHSRQHVLADDLSRMLGEPKKFSQYLGIAYLYDETDLRGLAGRVMEKHDLPHEAYGKYFFACLKGLVKKQATRQPRNTKKAHATTSNRKRTK